MNPYTQAHRPGEIHLPPFRHPGPQIAVYSITKEKHDISTDIVIYRMTQKIYYNCTKEKTKEL